MRLKKSARSPIKIVIPAYAVIIGSLILGLTYCAFEFYAPPPPANILEGSWQVCFTPNKDCQQAIISKINASRKSIFIQAYSFTDQDIVAALLEAQQRKVAIKVILDHSNLKDTHSQLNTLIAHKIPVRIDHPSGIAHNKIMIIDDHTLVTGSYNFSAAAYKRNTENVLMLNDTALAQNYFNNWQKRWDLSKDIKR